MGILPTNRTTSDTAATHVADHNTVHGLWPGGSLEKFRIKGATLDRRYVAGRVVGNATGNTASLAVNTMFFVPFINGSAATADRLGFEVQTAGAAGSVARVGIYSAKTDGTFVADTLLVDGGQYDATITGIKDTTISQALAAETLYWFSYLCGSAAPTIRVVVAAECYALLGTTGANIFQAGTGYSVAQTYGALPATAPAFAGSSNSSLPLIAVRLT